MATALRPRPRRRPSRRPGGERDGWLRSLSTLLTVVARGERLNRQPVPLSSSSRRLRQRLELGQRLLDPLPAPLRTSHWHEEVLWKALRWGGAGMLLAWWLLR